VFCFFVFSFRSFSFSVTTSSLVFVFFGEKNPRIPSFHLDPFFSLFFFFPPNTKGARLNGTSKLDQKKSPLVRSLELHNFPPPSPLLSSAQRGKREKKERFLTGSSFFSFCLLNLRKG